jgi:thiamine biosynthesis lipoprotein ApbE
MAVTMLPSGRPGRRPAPPSNARQATPAIPAAAWPAIPAAGRPAIPVAARPATLAAAWPVPAAAEWPALGTLAALAVTDPMALPEARDLLTAELAAVDAACSTYRDDSELLAVNAAARQGGPVRVSPLLAEAIVAALRTAEQTGGDVGPLAGLGITPAYGVRVIAGPPLGGTRLTGTRLTGAQKSGAPGRLLVATAASWRQVRLDQENCLLSIPPGCWLDLGGTAKAWAADRAAARIAARLGCGVLISLGGNVAAGGDAPRGGWRIRVQDTSGPGAGQPPGRAAVVSITSGGLATSGAGAVRWRHGGDVLQHILRPQASGSAVPAWRTASVTAATCAEASAASTAAIIRGSDAVGWLSGLGLPARLVDTAGRVTAVAGWPWTAEHARGDDARGDDARADTCRRTRPASRIPAGRTGRTCVGRKAEPR